MVRADLPEPNTAKYLTKSQMAIFPTASGAAAFAESPKRRFPACIEFLQAIAKPAGTDSSRLWQAPAYTCSGAGALFSSRCSCWVPFKDPPSKGEPLRNRQTRHPVDGCEIRKSRREMKTIMLVGIYRRS